MYVRPGTRQRRGLGLAGLADLVVRWNRGRGLGAIASGYTGVADAVVRQEGYNSALAPLNNPGNLIYAGQTGATPVTVNGTTWASWPTYDAGYQGLLNQIALDASRGLTISQFTAKYAPAASGNDPVTYAANIAAATGLSVNDPLSAAAAAGYVPSITDTGIVPTPDLTGGSGDLSSLLSDPWTLALGGLAAGLLVLAVLD